MQRDAGWLDIFPASGQKFYIGDRGRLSLITRELKDPRQQHASFVIFLGGRTKNRALQAIFKNNNIKRTQSSASVNLRVEVGTESSNPVLFADGNPQAIVNPRCSQAWHVSSYPISWSTPTANNELRFLYSRLLFLFCDVICLFADDFDSLANIADFLAFAADAEPLSTEVRPVVLIIFESGQAPGDDDLNNYFAHETDLSRSFSAIETIFLDFDDVRDGFCVATRYDRLKCVIRRQLDHAENRRIFHHVRFTVSHFKALFEVAIKRIATAVGKPFDYIGEMRIGNKVPTDLSYHLANYLKLGFDKGLQIEDLVPSIASSIIADNYPPGMHLSNPDVVFERLYRTPLVLALQYLHEQDPPATIPSLKALCTRVKREMRVFFSSLQDGIDSSIGLHVQQILSQSHLFGVLKSNKTCLVCRFNAPQHRLHCGHSQCDMCVWRLAEPAADIEYRFTIRLCYLCLSQVPLVVDLLPPTKRPVILSIDGGGARGVIPLEFLLLLEEKLACRLVEFCHLICGTSSGGITAEGILTWNLQTCSMLFERLARRVFEGKKISTLAWLSQSLVGRFPKWITWWLHDGCYDASVLESCLKETFGVSRRTFDAVGSLDDATLISQTKVGVVATDISRRTATFIFGNFNSCLIDSSQRGYKIIRPDSIDDDPFVWEATRATAAAPFIFPVAYMRNLGSFQDGGLKENNPAGIARAISQQIWPSRKAPALLISIGTGTEHRDYNSATNAGEESQVAPHFRNVFRDGMARRARDSWLSSLDGEDQWNRMMNQLNDEEKNDYIRLNVTLRGVDNHIDSVSKMEEYRDLVIKQPSTSKMILDAASALLVSCFYFVLTDPPRDNIDGIRCCGIIRCKPSVQSILPALDWLQSSDLMHFATETETLGCFDQKKDICPACSRYFKPVSFSVPHLDKPFCIYLKFRRHQCRKINGFPDSIRSFIQAQCLTLAFGTPHHDRPGVMPCSTCENCDFHEKQEQKRQPEFLQSERYNKHRRLSD